MANNKDLSASHVHAVLAAAMSDPSFLESWRRSRGSLRSVGLGSNSFDVDKIWRFSGLATKVRHNDVRLTFPLTFRLLDYADVSIEFFAEYAKTAAELRKAGIKSRDDKARALYDFLEEWLDRRKRVHVLLWDLIRHEKTIRELECSSVVGVVPTIAHQDVFPDPSPEFIPARTGNLVIHKMTFNPLDLAAIVRTNISAIQSLPSRRRHFVYCRPIVSDGIRIVEIDAIGSIILDLADGSRSISEIGALFRQIGISVETSDLRKPVRQLLDGGLLVAANNFRS